MRLRAKARGCGAYARGGRELAIKGSMMCELARIMPTNHNHLDTGALLTAGGPTSGGDPSRETAPVFLTQIVTCGFRRGPVGLGVI